MTSDSTTEEHVREFFLTDKRHTVQIHDSLLMFPEDQGAITRQTRRHNKRSTTSSHGNGNEATYVQELDRQAFGQFARHPAHHTVGHVSHQSADSSLIDGGWGRYSASRRPIEHLSL